MTGWAFFLSKLLTHRSKSMKGEALTNSLKSSMKSSEMGAVSFSVLTMGKT